MRAVSNFCTSKYSNLAFSPFFSAASQLLATIQLARRYRDFKKSLKQISDGKNAEAAKKAVDSLISVREASDVVFTLCILFLYYFS